MRIGMPEILTAGSVVLLATGSTTFGWVFLGLGVVGATLRWGIELQTAQQVQAAKQKEGEDLAKVFEEAGKAINNLLTTSFYSNNNDKNVH